MEKGYERKVQAKKKNVKTEYAKKEEVKKGYVKEQDRWFWPGSCALPEEAS